MAKPGEKPRHWLEFWPGFSLGSLATLAGGLVFALSLFFTFGQTFAAQEENDKRHDATDLRMQAEIDAIKSAQALQAEKIEQKLEETRRNVVALMVAQGVKPVGGGQ